MASARPPTLLNSRHRVVALLVAAGWRQKDIAEKLNYTQNWVSTIVSSPLFQTDVARLRRELEQNTFADVVTRLHAESGKTLQVLLDLRDTAENENVRLGATKELFDRQLPKIAHNVNEDRVVRVTLGGAEFAHMFAAMNEVRAARGASLESNGASPRTLALGATATAIEPRTIDDVLADEDDE